MTARDKDSALGRLVTLSDARTLRRAELTLHRRYSRLVSPGWKRKKDAEQVLRILVALLAPTIGPTVLSTMCGGLNVHA